MIVPIKVDMYELLIFQVFLSSLIWINGYWISILEIQLETLKFAQIIFYFVDITSKYLYHLCFGLYSFYGFDWFYYPFVDSQVSTMNERLELDSILFFKIHYSYSCSMSFKYIRSDLYFV